MKKFLSGMAVFLFFFSSFAAEPVQTRVSISSQPSGATVIIDGKDRGTTPVTLFDLAPGRHHLKFRLAGYGDRDRFFSTDEGTFIEKNEVLSEIKGLLLLKTDPAGADIQIDGVSVGQTPRLITNLSAKDVYSVRFRKAGYQDQTISVRFEGRKPLVREERLVLSSGTIDILSEPIGAEVTVNGITRGVTPVKVTDVPKGRATVKFHLDGFEDEVRELAINAGDQQTLPVILKPLPGTLHLVSVPDGARFYVNGEARGKGPLAIAGLKPGDYTIRAEMEGYGIMTKTVTLTNGMAAREEFKLSNIMGRLEVRTCPADVQVFVDGRFVGVTKSKDPNAEFSDLFEVENLMEGEHSLVLKKEGYADLVRRPKIQSEKTTKFLRQRLTRIFTPDIEIVTARGSYKGVLISNKPDSVIVEVSLGITRSFPRDEIRKMTFLKAGK